MTNRASAGIPGSPLLKVIIFISIASACIILYRAAQSAGLWKTGDLLLSFLMVAGIGAALAAGLWGVSRNLIFSGLTAGLSLIFYFLGATFAELLFQKISALSGYHFKVLPENTSIILFILSGVLFLGGIVLFYHQSKRNPSKSAGFLSLISWIVTAETLFLAFQTFGSSPDFPETAQSYNQYLPEKFPQKETLPDIYFLLFDEMMSPSALIQNYQLEEAKTWKDSLHAHDFFLSDSATSRFIETLESVHSVMNMDTVEYPFSLYKMRNGIQYSIVFQTLEKAGYQFFNYSIFPLLNQEVKSFQIDYFDRINGFPAFLYSGTWLKKMKKNKAENQREEVHSELLEEVKSVSKSPSGSPRFIYAHFMIPHPPFGLKKDGTMYSEEEMKSLSLTDLYLQQCLYAFDTGLHLAGSIQKNSSRPAVIILTGDHGFRVNYYGLKTAHPEQASQVFHAVYTPDSIAHYHKKDLTFTFAPLLNHYLKTTFPEMTDK